MPRATRRASRNEYSNEDLIKKYQKVLDDVQETLTITILDGKTPKVNDLLPKGDSKKPANSSILCINHLIKACGLMEEVRKIEGASKKTMQVARKLGAVLWKRMNCDDSGKIFFTELAQQIKDIHKSKYPNFKPRTKKSTLRQYKFKHVNKVENHVHMNNHQMIQPNITNITITPQLQFLPPPQFFPPQFFSPQFLPPQFLQNSSPQSLFDFDTPYFNTNTNADYF